LLSQKIELKQQRQKRRLQQRKKKQKKKAAATKEIADDAQRDLDEAIPALAAAVKCLDKLKKKDIQEVRALLKPPHGVKITNEAVCIMFEVKPKKIKDPENPMGPKILDYQEQARNIVLKDAQKMLQDMKAFDKDNIPDSVIEKVGPYITMEAFTPVAVRKSSVACEAICMWVRAMYKYHFVAKAVEPKRQALAQAQTELDETMAILKDAQERLDGVMARLKELELNFNKAVAKKDELANQVIQCQTRLDSAMKLIGGLGGEEVRWNEAVARLSHSIENVVGDVIVSAGTIAYLGAFTGDFRSSLCEQWREKMESISLNHTEGVNINVTLAEPVRVRQWNIWGLPTDEVSTENGVVIDKARRWPLCIDPQTQANRFIKRMAGEIAPNGYDVVKQSDKNILRTLENGVRFGKWVLMENVGESLDAALEPILQKNVFIQGGQPMIRLGESTVPYNDSFRFYMTTKLPNPHYPPEVCVKVTLLNFAITMQGLEAQLLGTAIKIEMPEVEERKNALVIQNADMNRTLKELEDKILKLLAESTGNILDDVVLIKVLDESTKKGAEVKQAQAEAKIVEEEIDKSRAGYVPVAQRGAVLFFCITDLAKVDPMYQYSLTWFSQLFEMALNEAEPSDDLEQRIDNLNKYFTYLLYDNVSRSLFERHKLLLSFTLLIKILQFDKQIDPAEWQFLISGQSVNPTDEPNPSPDWVITRVWNEICALDSVPIFKGIATGFKDNVAEWRTYFENDQAHRAVIPCGYHEKLNRFQKMCILRCLRPDKFVEAVQDYVSENLGHRFIEPPPFDLPLSYKAATTVIPLIFVLSVGVDPMQDFLNFSDDRGMRKKQNAISLGQGQGPKATKMIEQGIERGEWVFLQNCHLYVSWMVTLEAIVEQLEPDKVHKDFRLWLSSMPSKAFPVAILQNGVKMTNEPPKGLRASLKNTYYKMDDEKLNATNKPKKYKRLFFGLAFFHAVVIERKRYGALGWNIPYSFNETDITICTSQLQLYLDMYEEIPYDVLNLLTSFINYGGRVTDDKDLRTIDIILRSYYRPDILEEGYKLSSSGTYISPPVDDEHPLQSYNSYIEGLPIVPDPEVFSMHKNADITCAENDTYELVRTIMTLQPRSGGGGGISRADQILMVAKKIEDHLPPPDEGYMEGDATKLSYPIMYEESMNTVLVQEQEKFNRLLRLMKSTLYGVQLAVQGLQVMSTDLEDVANSFFENKVPAVWETVAYVSLKPLSAWVDELWERVKMMTDWVEHGTPKVFWISGFFFPQAFLTGNKQNFARKYQLPIDTINFNYLIKDTFKDDGSDITERPKDGCYIWGLQLEGARYSKETHVLADSHPRELYSALPVMHLDPMQNRPYTPDKIYRCPVYKTLTRAGTLSTTGHSTNFVCWVELPSAEPTIFRDSLVSETNQAVKLADAEKWIKAGVALFCQLRF
jgi:dynein heavy chain